MDDTTWRPGENQHQVGQKFLKFAMWSAAGDGIGESFQLLKMVNIQITRLKNEKAPWNFCLATPGKNGHHWLNP